MCPVHHYGFCQTLESNIEFVDYFYLFDAEPLETYPLTWVAEDIYYFPYLVEHNKHGDTPSKIIRAELVLDEEIGTEPWWKMCVYTEAGDIFEIYNYWIIYKNGDKYYLFIDEVIG